VPQRRRVDGLTSTPRQEPSWEKGGGWGRVTMLSRGVESSIAGGGGEMVRAPISWSIFFSFFLIHIFFVRYKNSHAALAMA